MKRSEARRINKLIRDRLEELKEEEGTLRNGIALALQEIEGILLQEALKGEENVF